MPTAAKMSLPTAVVPEGAPVALPGAAQLFAELLAGAGANPEQARQPAEEGTEETVMAEAGPETRSQAAILLPMLEQQQAAVPAPIAVRDGTPKIGARDIGPGARQPVETNPLQVANVAADEIVPRVEAPTANAEAPDSRTKVRADAKLVATPATALTPNPAPDVVPQTVPAHPAPAPASPRVAEAPGERAANTSAPEAAVVTQIFAGSKSIAPAGARSSPAAAKTSDAVKSEVADEAIQVSLPATLRVAEGRERAPVPAAPQVTEDAVQTPLPGTPTASPVPAEPPAEPIVKRPVQQASEPIAAAQPESAASSERAAANPLGSIGSSISVAAAPAAFNPAAAQPIATTLAAQVLDLSRGGEWIDQLARDIAATSSSDGSLRFRLAPETLGELRVEITQSDRGAHVRLQVTSEAAQQALAEAQPKLAAEARAQGLRIAESEISFTGGQGQSGRDAGRQAQAQPEQPLRAPRTGASSTVTNTDAAGSASRGRSDRYA